MFCIVTEKNEGKTQKNVTILATHSFGGFFAFSPLSLAALAPLGEKRVKINPVALKNDVWLLKRERM
jgi:hypothetical protein